MAIYIVMTLGAFLCVLQMRDAEGGQVESIASLSGLWRNDGALAAAFSVFMFSLAGIPPLFGFWAKFAVFSAAVDARLTTLAVIGIAASVIGAFYYLKIIKVMLFDPPAAGFNGGYSRIENALIAAFALVIALGYPLIPWLDAGTRAAARSLF